MKGFKLQITLQVTFVKEAENVETKHSPQIYFNSKHKALVNDLDIDGSLNTSYQTILSRIKNWLGEGSGWVFESIDGEYINISIYSALVESS